MFRIGMMMRSPKTKAMAPPKLMPPRHSTAASGTLPTEQTAFRLPAGALHQGRTQRQAEHDRQENDHGQAAGELRSEKLPAEQDEQHQAELEDEVGGGELEDDRVGQSGALSKECARQCN